MELTETFLQYLREYGLYFVFLIIFLEYLNLPGFPAGIILPATGVLAAQTNYSLPVVIFVSVGAGLLASIILYYVGSLIGRSLLDKLRKNYKKIDESINSTKVYIDKYGTKGVFISRLIPVARTLISFIAGLFKINIVKFMTYSVFGIAIYNSVFILLGFFGAEILIK